MAIPRRKFKNPPAQKTRSLRSGGFGGPGNTVPPDSAGDKTRSTHDRSQWIWHALRRGWSCSNHKQQLRLVLHALASSSKLAHRRRTARDALPPAGAFGNQVAEEDDSTCAAQSLEELDKIGSKQLLCASNSATCSAACEALLAKDTL